MYVLAINGSPRKNHNTAQLLQEALAGAAAGGAATEMINLYDYEYKGCISCFSCKRKDNPLPHHCAYQDKLSPVLEKAYGADALIFGSPIYLSDLTGLMRAFLERLLFPNISYDSFGAQVKPQKIRGALIVTMNMPKERQENYQWLYQTNLAVMKRVLGGEIEFLASYNTMQFGDYGPYATAMFDREGKEKTRRETFPHDCQEAYEIGRRLLAIP